MRASIVGVGVVACVVLAATAFSNLRALDVGGAFLRGHGTSLHAELTALGLVGPAVPAGFVPEPAWDPNLRMGDYADAVRELGSPAESASALRAAPEAAREAADRVVLRAVPPRIRAAPAGACGGGVTSPGLASQGRRLIVVSAKAFVLQIRLFASQFSRAGALLVPEGRHEVVLPAVRGAPWHAGADGPARVCVW